MKNIILAAIAAIVLSACATTSGKKVDQDYVASLKPGVTTIADVEAVLGKPITVNRNPDGTTTLTYGYASTKTSAAAYIPVVGTLLGKTDITNEGTFLEFSKSGRFVKSWSTSMSTAGAN